jgi:hypothetical protein
MIDYRVDALVNIGHNILAKPLIRPERRKHTVLPTRVADAAIAATMETELFASFLKGHGQPVRSAQGTVVQLPTPERAPRGDGTVSNKRLVERHRVSPRVAPLKSLWIERPSEGAKKELLLLGTLCHPKTRGGLPIAASPGFGVHLASATAHDGDALAFGQDRLLPTETPIDPNSVPLFLMHAEEP